MAYTKRLLISGVTGNIGQALTQIACKQDWQITGVARHASPHISPNISMWSLNLTDWDTTRSWVQIQEPFDLVVVAHGIQQPNWLLELTEPSYLNVTKNNLDSAVSLTCALIQQYKLKPNALIIYCSSLQAATPRVGRGAYAIAKAGLEALARVVAVELAPNRRAIALRLGQLTTPMQGIQFAPFEQLSLQQRALVSWVTPKDVAKLCLDLYWQKSMTGCVIDLDSGQGRNVW